MELHFSPKARAEVRGFTLERREAKRQTESENRMATEILSPTDFSLEDGDPLAPAHRQINAYLLRIPSDGFVAIATIDTDWVRIRALHLEAAREILALPVAQQLDCVRASSRFSYWSRFKWGWSSLKLEVRNHQGYEGALDHLCANILSFDRQWSEDEVKEIVALPFPYGFHKVTYISPLVEKYLENHPVTPSLRPAIEQVREWNAWLHKLPEWLRLGAALGENLVLRRGERWADEAIAFVEKQSQTDQAQWRDFLLHCIQSDKAKPAIKWLKTAQQHLDTIGKDVFEKCFNAWCIDYGQVPPSYELNRAVFKGLVWSASLLSGQEVALSVAFIALSGPSSRTGGVFSAGLFNACIWSLGEMQEPAARDQLLTLKPHVLRSRLKSIEKALDIIAARG